MSPSAISLPSGPGSIEGLGESFQPNLNTGTAKYGLPLIVPPGTAGHAPDLALSYEGGSGNGPLGYGWRLNLPFIQRQTDKGIPRYVDEANGIDDDRDGLVDEPDELDIFINELKEELVPAEGGFFFCENEGPFIRYRRVVDHWEAHLPDGTLLHFGLTSDGRVTDGSGRVLRWMLERETDTNGNVITYSYSSFPGSENLNQRYLDRIEYGPGGPPWESFHFLTFTYEGRSDWFEDNRGGFVVRTGKRLRTIHVGTQGADLEGHVEGDFNDDGIPDRLNRTYALDYSTHPHWSLLTSVTITGADGVSTLPPMTLGYTVADMPERISASAATKGGRNEPFRVMDHPAVDLIDLNGDGLPDILDTAGEWHTASLNRGEIHEGVDGGDILWESIAEIGCDSDQCAAWGITLSDTPDRVAHLADMDADGISDLVYRTALGEVFYFSNRSDGSWSDRKAMNIAPADSSPPSPYGTANVKSADLDFDKHMDIVQSLDENDIRIWFNLGSQQFSRSATFSPLFGFQLSDVGVHVSDFNGDRVPDVVRVRPTNIEVFAGLGHGQFTPRMLVPIPGDLDTTAVEKARLQDITGDGLAELVFDRPSPGQLWYWVNLGNYSLDIPRTIVDLPAVYGVEAEVRWADMNGNGTTDFVLADGSGDPRIATVDIGELIDCAPATNLLVRIENGIGRVINIGYDTSTRYLTADNDAARPWPEPLPFPVQVVSEVVVEDSMGHAYTTKYTYHNGYYDGIEREFRGFAEVERMEIGDDTFPTLVTAHRFDTGFLEESLKGKTLLLEARTAHGEVFHSEHYTWEARVLHESVSGDGRKVTLPNQTSVRQDILEKGSGDPVQILTEYEYDNYGNVTRQIDHGRTDAGWDDERIVETSYTSSHASGVSAWILNEVVEQRITDESGVLEAHRRNYYDGNAVPGEVSRGNLSRAEDWVKDDEYVASVRNEHDPFGNISFTYDPLYGLEPGHYRNFEYDPVFHASPVRETIYTGNAEADMLVYSAAYDYGFGTIVSSTEFNGHITAYAYDIFGRLTSITRPPDKEHTSEYEYVLNHALHGERVVNWIETRLRDGSPGDGFLVSREYSDGLGRTIMVRSEGENGTEVVVSDVVEFNARQQLWKTYLPYFESGTLDYGAPQLDGPATEHHYDALGRDRRLVQPAVKGKTFQVTMEYRPLETIVRDEEQANPESPHYGCGTRFVKDGLLNRDGNHRLREAYEIVKLSDDGRPSSSHVEWKTSYTYDLQGNLEIYEDSQGNRRLFSYDGLSRKTSRNDPDKGIMTFEYDQASNLVETMDAKGQRTRFSYDGANRMLTEDYLDEGLEFSANSTPDVTYVYDVPLGEVDAGDGSRSVASNTKGNLSWIRDISGEEHISYDERGRVSWVVKRVIDLLTGVNISFKTEFTHDSMNRRRSLIYPDNDLLTYRYSARGLLGGIFGGGGKSVVSQMEYDASGLPLVTTLGNGVVTKRHYDSWLRLDRLETYTLQEPESPILSYEYRYDGASNILRIDDLRPPSVLNAGDSKRNTQIFAYDDLYRLTDARYSFAAPGEPDSDDGWLAYRYDRIGNMLSKTSGIGHFDNGVPVTDIGDMAYGEPAGRFDRVGRLAGDPPGPHALTSTDNGTFGESLSYDANGNLTGIGGRTFLWDFNDRLIRVEDQKYRGEYLYDYNDMRVGKITIGPAKDDSDFSSAERNSTIYVNQYFELRGGQPTKYVADDKGKRIAKVTGTMTPGRERIQKMILHPGWNLVSAAVDSITGLDPDSGVSEAYRWDSDSHTWGSHPLSSPVAGGDIFWIHSPEALLLTLTGTYTEHPPPPAAMGEDYFGIGFNPASLALPLPEGSSLWLYDGLQARWRGHVGERGLPLPGDGPSVVTAGQAVYLRMTEGGPFLWGEQPGGFLYYHSDHLGSTSAVTDASGDVIHRRNYYPFGETRIQAHKKWFAPAYAYNEKEKDRESGLFYYGARHYHPRFGRWATPDPFFLEHPERCIESPRECNVYGYGANNPIKFVDPFGEHVAVPVAKRQSNSAYDAPGKPYTIYKFEVYDVDSLKKYRKLKGTLKPVTTFELTFDVQMNKNPSILRKKERDAQLRVLWQRRGRTRKGKYSLKISDPGKTKFTYPAGFPNENIRVHHGGPKRSTGCATTPDIRYIRNEKKMKGKAQKGLLQFEADIYEAMGLKKKSDKAYIILPGRKTAYPEYGIWPPWWFFKVDNFYGAGDPED